MADIVEVKLKQKGIFYLRDGTKFNVAEEDVNNLLAAQFEANKVLIKSGVITQEMLKKDLIVVLIKCFFIQNLFVDLRMRDYKINIVDSFQKISDKSIGVYSRRYNDLAILIYLSVAFVV